MKRNLTIVLTCFISCTAPAKLSTSETNHFPITIEKVKQLPAKENFYIYLMAGQSNMAGRGFVAGEDTLSSSLVLALDKNNEWVYAKEPLHYYEPTRTGLDCGLSFAKELSKKLGNKITIGLVPCAVGGSSIEQWLNNATYRGVTLYSNFLEKAKAAAQYGTIKGLLWHQGESNTGERSRINYKQKLETFFAKLRNDLQQPDLPIYMGTLGSYLTKYSFPYTEEINKDIKEVTESGKNIYLIKTSDFTHLKDTIHFDSPSQRSMGKRFAKAVYKNKQFR
jgi:hypothetical protein